MICFRHPEDHAVGFCKNCFRALCSQCVIDVGGGLACRNLCESEVRALKQYEALVRRAPFRGSVVAAIGSVLMFAIGLSWGIHFFLPCIIAGVLFGALACWEVSTILKSRNPKLLNQIPKLHGIDSLEQEFKKLESDSKQNKDTN